MKWLQWSLRTLINVLPIYLSVCLINPLTAVGYYRQGPLRTSENGLLFFLKTRRKKGPEAPAFMRLETALDPSSFVQSRRAVVQVKENFLSAAIQLSLPVWNSNYFEHTRETTAQYILKLSWHQAGKTLRKKEVKCPQLRRKSL